MEKIDKSVKIGIQSIKQEDVFMGMVQKKLTCPLDFMEETGEMSGSLRAKTTPVEWRRVKNSL